MPQYIQLPNGAYFEVKEGETPEDALIEAASRYPALFKQAEPEAPKEDKQGFMAGIRSGIENLKGDVGALGGGLGIEGGE